MKRIFETAGLCLAAILLSGCISEGAAFGLGAGALREHRTYEKTKKQPPPIYGPPQIIYRIDDHRYFTLENYTRCENGQTFYNNREKAIHVKVSNASGYLFKGRLFWLSQRDDYLAFPSTANTRTNGCMGSDKGCMNAISVTTDGGKHLHAVAYGSYTMSPTEDTRDYDMLVTDDGFYTVMYWFGKRIINNTVVYKWLFFSKNGVMGATGPVYHKELPMDDISGVMQTTLQCDRTKEPVQPIRRVTHGR